MPIHLSNIHTIVNRSIYNALRLALLELGYLPDIMDTGRYPDNDQGVANWESDLETIVQDKGFAIEIFGSGSNEKKYAKKTPRIVYLPKRMLPGDLGGNQGAYYEPDGNGGYTALAQPPRISNKQFEISLVAKTEEQSNVLHQVMGAVLSTRAYVPFYDDPNQEFFVVQQSYREYPDTAYGLLEYIYLYEARDLWDQLRIKEQPIAPLSEVIVEIKLDTTPDEAEPDAIVEIP